MLEATAASLLWEAGASISGLLSRSLVTRQAMNSDAGSILAKIGILVNIWLRWAIAPFLFKTSPKKSAKKVPSRIFLISDKQPNCVSTATDECQSSQ